MPPRFAYWTILIDNAPTAFRAQNSEDLLPTLVQLRRTNRDVVMKWFARGRLWDSPETARLAFQRPKPKEQRSAEWRPGGRHADPRARFRKRPNKSRPAPGDRSPDERRRRRPSPHSKKPKA